MGGIILGLKIFMFLTDTCIAIFNRHDKQTKLPWWWASNELRFLSFCLGWQDHPPWLYQESKSFTLLFFNIMLWSTYKNPYQHWTWRGKHFFFNWVLSLFCCSGTNVYKYPLFLKEKLPAWHCVLQVFMILTSQLLVTFVTVAVCTLNENAKKFVQANPWMVYLSFFVNLVVLIVLLCFKDLSRRYPWNLVALVGITGTSHQTVQHASVHHT